ncbi:MAG TPA: hypothetical protein VIL45_06325, partial [Thermoplasmata archaeon]
MISWRATIGGLTGRLPGRALPRRAMFRAAFKSAFKRRPQAAQENSLPARVPLTPHREQSWLVYSGGTSTT